MFCFNEFDLRGGASQTFFIVRRGKIMKSMGKFFMGAVLVCAACMGQEVLAVTTFSGAVADQIGKCSMTLPAERCVGGDTLDNYIRMETLSYGNVQQPAVVFGLGFDAKPYADLRVSWWSLGTQRTLSVSPVVVTGWTPGLLPSTKKVFSVSVPVALECGPISKMITFSEYSGSLVVSQKNVIINIPSVYPAPADWNRGGVMLRGLCGYQLPSSVTIRMVRVRISEQPTEVEIVGNLYSVGNGTWVVSSVQPTTFRILRWGSVNGDYYSFFINNGPGSLPLRLENVDSVQLWAGTRPIAWMVRQSNGAFVAMPDARVQ